MRRSFPIPLLRIGQSCSTPGKIDIEGSKPEAAQPAAKPAAQTDAKKSLANTGASVTILLAQVQAAPPLALASLPAARTTKF